MSWFGRKAAPAQAANGTKRQFSKEELNRATVNLQTALSKIANQHVLKYANDIRAQAKANANAARANAVAAAAPTPTSVAIANNAARRAAAAAEQVRQSGNAAAAVVNTVPQGPAHNQTLAAEGAAVKAVIKNIQNMNKPLNVNAIRTGNTYTKGSNNNRRRINNAVNARSAATNPFANKKSNNINLNASSLYAN